MNIAMWMSWVGAPNVKKTRLVNSKKKTGSNVSGAAGGWSGGHHSLGNLRLASPTELSRLVRVMLEAARKTAPEFFPYCAGSGAKSANALTWRHDLRRPVLPRLPPAGCRRPICLPPSPSASPQPVVCSLWNIVHRISRKVTTRPRFTWMKKEVNIENMN